MTTKNLITLLRTATCFEDINKKRENILPRPRNLRRYYESVPVELFNNLMLLQMADAVTHDMERTLIRERYEICKTLYEGKAEELYQWLREEGK